MFRLCVPEDPPWDSLNLRSKPLSSSTAVKSKLGRSVVQGLVRTLDSGHFLGSSSLLVNRGKKFKSCLIAFMQTKASWAANKILRLSLFEKDFGKIRKKKVTSAGTAGGGFLTSEEIASPRRKSQAQTLTGCQTWAKWLKISVLPSSEDQFLKWNLGSCAQLNLTWT